jgi:hypothetical protein
MIIENQREVRVTLRYIERERVGEIVGFIGASGKCLVEEVRFR